MNEFSLKPWLLAAFLAVVPATLVETVVARSADAAPPAVSTPNLLVDVESGRVLYAEEADRRWHPASTTKLMTAYVVFEDLRTGKLKLDDAVIQSERSIKEPPSKIGLAVGLGMTVDLALQSLIVKSANDVAVMLAEKVGGSVEGFVARMNATAKRLDMTETSYVNPNGLHDEGQITTARDLAKLTLALMRDFPEHNDRFKQYYMNIGKRKLHSYNSLLRSYEGTDGMKTGFVCASGYNVVASATRNGHRLIAVVLGARNMNDRAARASRMFDYGFEFYDWEKLVAANLGDQKVDGRPLAAETAAAPGNMRDVVCRARTAGSKSLKKKQTKRKSGRRSKMRSKRR